MDHTIRIVGGVSIWFLVLCGCETLVWADPSIGNVARWPIVTSPQPPPAERYAAEELQRLMRLATGIEPKIVTEETPSRFAIRIGVASKLDSTALGDEDYLLRVSDSMVDIKGGSPRGTLYGVYAWLEDDFQIRFLTPDHTHVPVADHSRSLASRETIFRPRFSWRYSYYAIMHDHPEFATRLRNNAVTSRDELGGRNPWNLIGHSVDRWVPVARLGSVSPDYFSLVDGRRRSFMKDDQFEQGGTQPCFTHPDVQRLLIDGVRSELAARRQTSGSIAVGQNDNQMYCRCPKCEALDEREESHMASLLTAVNTVAREIAEEYPQVRVGTLAYQFSRRPPKHLSPLPNVAIQLCSIEACLLHPLNDPDCPQNVEFHRDLQRWSELSDQLYVWNYNVNFANYQAPCPNLNVIGPNLRILARHRVRGVFMQCAGNAHNTELDDLRNYLISNLLWDPARNDQALIDEFLDLHYGRGASHVHEYLRLIDNAAQSSGLHNACYGLAASYGVSSKTARDAIRILDQAIVSADDEQVSKRIRKLTLAPRAALIDPLAKWLGQHFSELRNGRLKAVPPEVYSGIEDELREYLRLCRDLGVDRVSEWTTLDEFRSLFPDDFVSK